jgi:glycine/D-amino acid oxidase-like deaminating enzyme
MPAEVEFLIVGQGLAGTALAWELAWRGREVLVVDPGEKVTSSRIAAGLVTPITGQRLALGWRVDEMLGAARPFYARVEAEVQMRVFHPRVVRRIFRSAEEATVWEKRRHDPARQPHIARAHVPEAGPFGGCAFFGAHLDTASYLTASRAAFSQRGCLLEARLDPLEAADWPAKHVIFCQGYEASRNPFFDRIRWRAAKGEILTVRTTGLDRGTILSAGQWIVPLEPPPATAAPPPQASRSEPMLARTGSTYDWDTLDTKPTAAARAQLESGLARLHDRPFEVVDHQAAVRPIICESRAVIGRHPAREKLGFFNGLGSKGSLHAPFFALQLAAHLVEGAPLEEAGDLRRNPG